MSTNTVTTAAAVEAVTTASRELIAPPFDGWLRAATPPDPGFWTAVRHNAANGGSVAQLGAKPHPANAPRTQGDLLVGWERHRDLPAGPASLTAYFDLGPITRAPRGGTVQTFVYFLVNGPSGLLGDLVEVFRGQPDAAIVASSFGHSIHAGTYRFRFGSYIFETYAGGANPYGEVIVDGVRLYDDHPGLAASAARSADPLLARLSAKDELLRLVPVEQPINELIAM